MSFSTSHIEGDDIPFEERDKIWSLIYTKVSEAVDRKERFAILFSTMVGGNYEKGYSAIITQDQYEVLLNNFLLWSEENERYELCIEVKEKINKLKQWTENC